MPKQGDSWPEQVLFEIQREEEPPRVIWRHRGEAFAFSKLPESWQIPKRDRKIGLLSP